MDHNKRLKVNTFLGSEIPICYVFLHRKIIPQEVDIHSVHVFPFRFLLSVYNLIFDILPSVTAVTK